jgi:hypothetical protein
MSLTNGATPFEPIGAHSRTDRAGVSDVLGGVSGNEGRSGWGAVALHGPERARTSLLVGKNP